MPVSVNLTGQSTNPMMDAYQARTNQLTQQRYREAQRQQQEADRRTTIMSKALSLAGDGYTDEAMFLARQNNLDIPPEILTNADFAKGASLADKFYSDPAQKQKFAMAWHTNQGGDFNARFTLAQQAAGNPIDTNDREYERKKEFELWKQNNGIGGGESSQFTKPPSRFEAGQDAYQAVISNFGNADQAEVARQQSYAEWDKIYGQQQAPGGAPAPVAVPAAQPTQGNVQKGVYAIQQLMLKGYNANQIAEGLRQRGASDEQIKALLSAAGMR